MKMGGFADLAPRLIPIRGSSLRLRDSKRTLSGRA